MTKLKNITFAVTLLAAPLTFTSCDGGGGSSDGSAAPTTVDPINIINLAPAQLVAGNSFKMSAAGYEYTYLMQDNSLGGGTATGSGSLKVVKDGITILDQSGYTHRYTQGDLELRISTFDVVNDTNRDRIRSASVQIPIGSETGEAGFEFARWINTNGETETQNYVDKLNPVSTNFYVIRSESSVYVPLSFDMSNGQVQAFGMPLTYTRSGSTSLTARTIEFQVLGRLDLIDTVSATIEYFPHF